MRWYRYVSLKNTCLLLENVENFENVIILIQSEISGGGELKERGLIILPSFKMGCLLGRGGLNAEFTVCKTAYLIHSRDGISEYCWEATPLDSSSSAGGSGVGCSALFYFIRGFGGAAPFDIQVF